MLRPKARGAIARSGKDDQGVGLSQASAAESDRAGSVSWAVAAGVPVPMAELVVVMSNCDDRSKRR
jgi:hypothetical protein